MTTQNIRNWNRPDLSLKFHLFNHQLSLRYTLAKIQNRFYTLTQNNKVHTVNHNLNELIPTQHLDPLYEENSCLYIFTKYTLFQRHHRVGNNPYLYIMSNTESIDIDYESDFVMAESLYKTLQWKNDKIVLITGCDGGIGTELCKTFQKNVFLYMTSILLLVYWPEGK